MPTGVTLHSTYAVSSFSVCSRESWAPPCWSRRVVPSSSWRLALWQRVHWAESQTDVLQKNTSPPHTRTHGRTCTHTHSHTHTHTSPSQPACCLVPQLLAVSPSERGDQAPDFPSWREGRRKGGKRGRKEGGEREERRTQKRGRKGGSEEGRG